jgi:MIP family channel proteins
MRFRAETRPTAQSRDPGEPRPGPSTPDREARVDKGMKSYVAEFLGTFTLCFIGQGAILANQLMGAQGPGLLGIAVAHGLALAIMISALGAVSGGHFNPAVTFGFLVTGRQSVGSSIAYWVSQLLGAVVASYLLTMVIPSVLVDGARLGAAGLGEGITPGGAMLIELVLTFMLVTAVWGTAVDPRAPKIGGFGIGLTVTMGILLAGPFTGGALNPARAFGAALVMGAWGPHWVWWVGPLAGGAIAALVYRGLFLNEKS